MSEKEEKIEEVKVEAKPTTEEEFSTKNRFTMLMLCWFLGIFGVHRLYAGKIGSGFLMLYGTIVSLLVFMLNTTLGQCYFIVMGTLVINDFVCIACKCFKDVYGKYVVSDKVNN